MISYNKSKNILKKSLIKIGEEFTNKKGRRIMSSINEKGKYYHYFQENKEDLLWFYSLHKKFRTSKRQLAITFPDTL